METGGCLLRMEGLLRLLVAWFLVGLLVEEGENRSLVLVGNRSLPIGCAATGGILISGNLATGLRNGGLFLGGKLFFSPRAGLGVKLRVFKWFRLCGLIATPPCPAELPST